MPIRRAKGTGSVQKKGSKYYFRIKINGKEIVRRMPEVASDKEADIEATRLYAIASARTQEEVALFAGRARNIIKDNKTIPLKDAFDRFVKSSKRPNANEKTIGQHCLYWTGFINWLEPEVYNISDVEENLIDEFFSAIRAEKNPRTYNCILKTLKLVFRIVYPDIPNPCRFVQKRNEMVKHHMPLDKKQLEQIFNAVDREYPLSIPHREEMAVLFRLGAYTGMRLKDCCLLKWEAVNLADMFIRVNPAKTASSGRKATIPIHTDLLECLNRIPQGNGHDYILPNVAERYTRNRTGVNKSANMIIWHAVSPSENKRQRPVSIEGYGFHSLRHAFVTFCANAGVPLDVVKEIVGHGSTAVTNIYTHYSTDTLRQAVNAIPGKKQSQLSEREKLERIKAILDGKTRLTAVEKEIVSILK